MASSVDDTWLGGGMFAVCEDPQLLLVRSGEEGTTALPGCAGLTLSRWYLSAFAWSIMVITGTGGTGPWPTANSDTEMAFVICLVIIGAFLWTSIIARFCEVATNSNPGLTAFLQRLDDLNQFAHVNGLPVELSTRLREYMHEQKNIHMRTWAARAVSNLSAKLQAEVLLHVHSSWLERIWFVRGFERLCKVRLAMAMELMVLSPGEVAPKRSMYVIQRGLVLYGMRVLHGGDVWGDDVILENEAHALPYVARAATYVEVVMLSRAKLLEAITRFPASLVVLKRAGAYLALRRHMIVAAREMRARSEKTDFIDTVHLAAQRCEDDEDTSTILREESDLKGGRASLSGAAVAHAGRLDEMSVQLKALQDTCEQLVASVAAIGQAQERLASSVIALRGDGGGLGGAAAAGGGGGGGMAHDISDVLGASPRGSCTRPTAPLAA